jgi:hypothetical protein
MRLVRPAPASLLLAALLLAATFLSAAVPVASAGSDERAAALVKRLKGQRLASITFEKADLETVVKWLRVATASNIVLKRAALAKAGIEWQDIEITVELSDVRAWTFVKDVLLEPHGMAPKVTGNILFITSKADTYEKPVTRLYGISHITWRKVDFIGPTINLNPSGLVEDEYLPEVVDEDDLLADGDAVAGLLKELVVPQAWDAHDDWAIRATERYLVIRAPLAVHALVPRALAKIAALK